MSRPCLLVILDGYGVAGDPRISANSPANAPYITSRLIADPSCRLSASGLDVGLPAGQMGNSEVGHSNMGAGRIVWQDLTRIDLAIDDGSFFENPAFARAARAAAENGGAVHAVGLVSDGGVHSSEGHYFALLDAFRRLGAPQVHMHCFLDGRDVSPVSGEGFLKSLQDKMTRDGYGVISSVAGRYWGMDRDSRHERTAKAYAALTGGSVRRVAAGDLCGMVRESYAAGVTDEFFEPVGVVDGSGTRRVISGGDSVVFFNFRADRARQMTRALMQNPFTDFPREPLSDLYFVSMTSYDDSFTFADVAFPPQNVSMSLGEHLSSLGMRQLRLAETEKYAHVTYFFSGGREEPFEGEDRMLAASPRVATYDLAPRMSARKVTSLLTRALAERKYDFVVVNYANCDMVGHTGDLDAAREAVRTVDACVREALEAADGAGYVSVVTADHGNVELMRNPDGSVHTAHTTNPVPLFIHNASCGPVRDGRLCDVAPTILSLMGIGKPAEMNGDSLVDMEDVV